jgi:hypothetical protein|tara:strand:+ start:855 stop:1994 length:1140 start_codon:yes stop_codon:yes gene_type:complete
MVNIDNLVNEWAYRCEKGYPNMDSPSDLRLLKVILKEEGITIPQFQQVISEQEEGPSKKELIDLINKVDLSPKALTRIIKVVKGTGFRTKTKDLLSKNGFTEKDFKSGDADIDRILNTITNSEVDELFKYLENPKALSSFPPRGNLVNQLGISSNLAKDLMGIEGTDEGGSNIGKIEIFLALILSDVDNRKGGGDLNWSGVGNLEVKGAGGRAGQQGGRGNYVNGQNRIADEFVPQGDEREEFESNSENKLINYCLKNGFDYVSNNDGDIKEYINFIQKLLDEAFFNKGLAKKYFNKAEDFKDLAVMRNKIFKLNIEAYAEKTNVDAFMFASAKTGEYAIIDIDKVGEAIDQGIIRTTVDPKLGYSWHNPNPNINLGKK